MAVEALCGLLVGGCLGYFAFGLPLGVVVVIELMIVLMLGGILGSGAWLLRRDERRRLAQYGGHACEAVEAILAELDQEFPGEGEELSRRSAKDIMNRAE